MIQSFRHKGLQRLHDEDSHRGVRPDHAERLSRILARLEASAIVADMDLPGYRLHPLKGKLAGFHSVSVSGNWRVIFRFEAGHVYEVDYLDYH